MLQGILLEIDTKTNQGKIEQAVNKRQYLFDLELWEGKENELVPKAEIEFEKILKSRKK